MPLQKLIFFYGKLYGVILSTNLNLITHFVNVEPECKRCGLEFETIEHALMVCSGVAECWSLLHILILALESNEPIDK